MVIEMKTVQVGAIPSWRWILAVPLFLLFVPFAITIIGIPFGFPIAAAGFLLVSYFPICPYCGTKGSFVFPKKACVCRDCKQPYKVEIIKENKTKPLEKTLSKQDKLRWVLGVLFFPLGLLIIPPVTDFVNERFGVNLFKKEGA